MSPLSIVVMSLSGVTSLLKICLMEMHDGEPKKILSGVCMALCAALVALEGHTSAAKVANEAVTSPS